MNWKRIAELRAKTEQSFMISVKDAAYLIATVEELAGALKLIRFSWGGHAEQCALVHGGKCDCDWPSVAAVCDAALAKLESSEARTCETCNRPNTTGCSYYYAEDCGPGKRMWQPKLGDPS